MPKPPNKQQEQMLAKDSQLAEHTPLYNPVLSYLIDESIASWGNASENRHSLIQYGLGPDFDNAVVGLGTVIRNGELHEGEVVAIQAEEKNRKTTLLLNLYCNFLPQLEKLGYWAALDTLESGMTPIKFTNMLIAMYASRIVLAEHYQVSSLMEFPPPEKMQMDGDLMRQLKFRNKFFYYAERTPLQQKAIDVATAALKKKPLTIFGGAKVQGNTRNIERAMERWSDLYRGDHPQAKGCKHLIFALDNIQQSDEYNNEGHATGLDVVVRHVSNFVVNHPGAVVFMISQVSAGSTDNGVLRARGGKRLAEEITSLFEPRYSEDNKWYIDVSNPRSRETPAPRVLVPIDPFSGRTIGPCKVK